MEERVLECPLCGSRRLFVRSAPRKVVIGENGGVVPLLTKIGARRPVVQTSDVTYHCVCSWSGAVGELGSRW